MKNNDYKNYEYENNKLKVNFAIFKLMIKNPGKLYRDRSMIGTPIIRSNESYKKIKLPKDYKVYVEDTNDYRDTAFAVLVKGDKKIVPLQTSIVEHYNKKETKKLITEMEKLNPRHIRHVSEIDGFYRVDINLPISEIALPENIKYKIELYPPENGNTISCALENKETKEKIPLLINCYYKTKEELEAEQEELIRKAINVRKEQREQVGTIYFNNTSTSTYERYREFLINHGASRVILDFPAIDELIKDIINRGDQRLILEGHSVIGFNNPHDDGTFDIYGKTNGPFANEIYHMSYCHDGNPEHLLKLVREKTKTVHYTMDEPIGNDYQINEEETIYINCNGERVSTDKKVKRL